MGIEGHPSTSMDCAGCHTVLFPPGIVTTERYALRRQRSKPWNDNQRDAREATRMSRRPQSPRGRRRRPTGIAHIRPTPLVRRSQCRIDHSAELLTIESGSSATRIELPPCIAHALDRAGWRGGLALDTDGLGPPTLTGWRPFAFDHDPFPCSRQRVGIVPLCHRGRCPCPPLGGRKRRQPWPRVDAPSAGSPQLGQLPND